VDADKQSALLQTHSPSPQDDERNREYLIRHAAFVCSPLLSAIPQPDENSCNQKRDNSICLKPIWFPDSPSNDDQDIGEQIPAKGLKIPFHDEN